MFADTKELRMLADTVRRAAREKIAPLAASIDEKGEFNREVAALFWDLGLMTLTFPPRHGGMERDQGTALSLTVEEIARHCASSSLLLIIQAVGCFPIIHGGRPELLEKLLPRMAENRELAAYLVTEPSAGSDLLGMKSRAVRQGDHYVINGQKCFITNGSVADMIVVYAYTDPGRKAKGISAFVVEKGTPGLIYGRNESKMGMRGSVNSELFFEDMKVPAENRIGEEGGGFANLMTTLSMNRIFCAAQAVGIAQGALDEATRHARERIQFGKPIAHQPVIQSMVADMATAVEAARLLTREAAALFDEGDARQGALFGGMAKTFASDTAMQVTTDSVQILGGYGYMKDHSVERMMRDAKLTQIYTGTNQITRLVTGRSLLLS